MICETCGHELEIGEWPYCPHGPARQRLPFRPWYDEHLGLEVTSLSQWNRAMRDKKYELRDTPARGELAAREDRARQHTQEIKHAR